MDIREFLAARLDEDEAAAKGVHAIDKASWRVLEWYDGQFEGGETARVDLRSRTGSITDRGSLPRSVGAHIIRHDPARVLAEVAGKRAIVERHGPDARGHCKTCLTDRAGRYPEDWDPDALPCDMLKLLAAPYAEHPDYDPTWAVE